MDLDVAPAEDNPLFEPKADQGKWASCLRVLDPFRVTFPLDFPFPFSLPFLLFFLFSEFPI